MWLHGLPEHGCVDGITFNLATGGVIVAFSETLEDHGRTRSLYYRLPGSEEYRPIPRSGPEIHYTDAICTHSEPIVYFNVQRWVDGGGYWAAVSSFDLKTGRLETVISKEGLAGLDSDRLWVNQLLSVKEGGKALIATVAIFSRIGPDSLKAAFWISELQLAPLKLTKLVLLPQNFA